MKHAECKPFLKCSKNIK